MVANGWFRTICIELSDISITVFVIQAGFEVLRAIMKSVVFWFLIRCTVRRDSDVSE
jgi:hypothetical protein